MPPPCGGRGEAVHGHGHGASSCDEYVISYSWGGAVIGVHVSRMCVSEMNPGDRCGMIDYTVSFVSWLTSGAENGRSRAPSSGRPSPCPSSKELKTAEFLR